MHRGAWRSAHLGTDRAGGGICDLHEIVPLINIHTYIHRKAIAIGMSNKYNYGNCLCRSAFYYDNLIDPCTIHSSGDKKETRSGTNLQDASGRLPTTTTFPSSLEAVSSHHHHQQKYASFHFSPSHLAHPSFTLQKVHEHIRSAHQIIRGATLRHQ